MCEEIRQIPITDIRPFGGDYGKSYFHMQQEKVEELADSIKSVGVLVPLIVRADASGKVKYELIAGKTRLTAAERVGLETVPCVIRQLDDDAALCLYGESNRYREDITITEKAFMVRYADEYAEKCKTDPRVRNAIFDESEERQLRRYIRLTYLSLGMRQLVDVRKVSIKAGCEISYLPLDVQDRIVYILSGEQTVLSLDAAEKIRSLYDRKYKPFGKTMNTKELSDIIYTMQPERSRKAHLTVDKGIIKMLPPEYQSKKAYEMLVENLLKNFSENF